MANESAGWRWKRAKHWLCLACAALSWACGGATESAGSGDAVDAHRTPQALGPPQVLTPVVALENLMAAEGFLYWTAYDTDESGHRPVRRIAERGGEVQTVVSAPFAPYTVLNGWLYGGSGDGVARVSVEGGKPEAFAVTPHFYQIRHTATALYSACGLGVTRVELATGAVSALGKSDGYTAEGLVVDESSAYWSAAGEVLRVAQTGGPTERLAPYAPADDLAVDSAAVYFSDRKQLFRRSKSGGAPVPLGPANARALEVFGDYLYWVGPVGTGPASVVVATPLRNAGPDVVIATTAERVSMLAVSDAGVFWSSQVDNAPGAYGKGAIYAAYWCE